MIPIIEDLKENGFFGSPASMIPSIEAKKSAFEILQ
jgi:hypothetical protein